MDCSPEQACESRAAKILQETYQLENFDEGIYFVDQEGKAVVIWPEETSSLLGRDLSGSPTFDFIRIHWGLAIITNIEPAGPHGEDIACLAVSVEDGERGFAGGER